MGKNTLTEFNQAAKTLIESGLQKLFVYNGMVNRGMIIKQKEFERIFGEDMVQQNRFISSSKDVNVALDFAIRNQSRMKKNEIQVVFEITSKNGRNISDISKLEIMFTSNTSFRSEKTETTDNDVWGKLTEL